MEIPDRSDLMFQLANLASHFLQNRSFGEFFGFFGDFEFPFMLTIKWLGDTG